MWRPSRTVVAVSQQLLAAELRTAVALRSVRVLPPPTTTTATTTTTTAPPPIQSSWIHHAAAATTTTTTTTTAQPVTKSSLSGTTALVHAPLIQRSFSSSSSTPPSNSNSKSGKKKKNRRRGGGPKIAARPAGETPVASKFALPDRDKEQELAQIQTRIQEAYKAGSYRQGLALANEYEQECTTHFGPDHPATASAWNNVGLLHKQLGDFDQARFAYQRALKIYKRVVGPDHASTASLWHNLGNLNRVQIHTDTSLRATDRLSLLEEATRSLQQAYQIRLAERGPTHPHTVASRSSWGAALATHILQRSYKQQQQPSLAPSAPTATMDDSVSSTSYVALRSDEVTRPEWEAAEEHLRAALDTAVANPRGPGLKPSKNSNTSSSKIDMTTLSAAAAGQNLAIFLKTRGTVTRSSQPPPRHGQPQSDHQDEHTDDDKVDTVDEGWQWMEEARDLYQQVLTVRQQLLPKDHPDLYATQFSLAELLHAMGDEEAANAIRQEIVDTYDPPTEAETTTKTTTS